MNTSNKKVSQSLSAIFPWYLSYAHDRMSSNKRDNMTNLTILNVIIDILKEKKVISSSGSKLDSMYNFFKKVDTEKNKFNYAYLHYLLYKNISKDDVSKRKTTARDFEDVLAVIFDGKVTDEEKRFNENNVDFLLENETLTEFAISNKREKADIKFENNYYLSVKTLMHDNKEINFGSLEKTTLFGGFGVASYLNERKGNNSENIGLGSRPRLLHLLQKIESEGNYKKFQERFVKLIKFVFSDDLVILIKSKMKMELYFISNSDFITLLTNKSSSPDDLVSIVNRWEGNSIRMDRKDILTIGKKIVLDFEFLNSHIVSGIEEVEEKISSYFIKYVNSYPHNKMYREKIAEECDLILDRVDKNIESLI